MSKKILGIVALIGLLVVFLLALHFSLNSGERRNFGVRDEEKYNQTFSQMALVIEGETNFFPIREQFSTTDVISLLMNVTHSTEIWVSIDNGRTGKYTGIETRESVQVGIHSVILGTFSKGEYIARVLADDILVKNIQFKVD